MFLLLQIVCWPPYVRKYWCWYYKLLLYCFYAFLRTDIISWTSGVTFPPRERTSQVCGVRFGGGKSISEVLEMQFWGQKSIPEVWGMVFRIAKPIPKVVECWRKMRNHSAEMKSLIAKCAACFFSEKSNFQPGIGLFIFEKSNRKLRRILFFWKVQFPNRN